MKQLTHHTEPFLVPLHQKTKLNNSPSKFLNRDVEKNNYFTMSERQDIKR